MRDQDSGPEFFIDYSRFVTWGDRLEREAPFILRALSNAPKGAILDLGCGSGQHSRLLAESGFNVLGIDRSERMLERASTEKALPGLEFLQCDLRELGPQLSGTYAGAICLGNTLASLDAGGLESLLQSLQHRLLVGSPFVVQVLNYERILERGIRYLPPKFLDDGIGELILFRLMKRGQAGEILFTPLVLHWSPEAEDPIRVSRAETVRLTPWSRDTLFPVLDRFGFQREEVSGDFAGSSFDPAESSDLILVLRR